MGTALEVAKDVLQTGEEYFAELLESAVFKGPELAPEFAQLLQGEFAAKMDSDFLRLLEQEFAPKQLIADEAVSNAERIAAQSAIDAGLESLGAETVSGIGLETTAVAGSAVLTFGLVLILEAEKYAINYVKKWRLQLALAVGISAAGAKLVSGLADFLRSKYPDPQVAPDLQPWPDTWPDDDLKKKKETGEKRFRRMGRQRHE